MSLLNKLYKTWDQPMIFDKGQYIPYALYNQDKHVIKSGSEIIGVNGETSEFEFTHKSRQNTIAALVRHFGTKNQPDPASVRRFDRMKGPFFDYLKQKLKEDPIEFDKHLLDYSKTQDSWTDAKKAKYDGNIARFF